MNLSAAMRKNDRFNTTDKSIHQVLKGTMRKSVAKQGRQHTDNTPAFLPSQRTSDISSLDFFTFVTHHFTTTEWTAKGEVKKGSLDQPFDGESGCCIHPDVDPKWVGALPHMHKRPDIWIEADTFAKVFYSVILADLGQPPSPSQILGNASLLAFFSKNITDMKQGYKVETYFLPAGPANTSYRADDEKNGKLDITPSVFFTEYLCQVPTLKSAGSLILAVLVADLVFLNAAWMLLNWFAGLRLESKGQMVYYCAGCAGGAVMEMSDVEANDNAKIRTRTSGYERVGRGDVG
jgi:hypothetical protein